jgi:hypothetical protein
MPPMGMMPNLDADMPHIPVTRDPFGYKLPEELANEATKEVNEGKDIGDEDEKGNANANADAGGNNGGGNAGGKNKKNKRKKK